MTDLADFVLDFCRAFGGLVEPPAYGVYEVLLPDPVAAQLDVEPFQRWTFAEANAEDEVTQLSYGHPLIERMIELARAQPACACFYVNDVRLDKTGLAALARNALTFPNTNLVEIPRTLESRALFRYVQFNFKAALIADEKREHLVSVLMDAQTGIAIPDLSPEEQYRLAVTPAFTDLPIAPAQWTRAPDPLAPEPLRALLDRAARAAVESLADPIAGLQKRAARLLELDRARLDAYYADLERDLERRLKRADDEAKRSGLESKLAALRADHGSKLADAEAKYQLRVEPELINLAVIAQPKLTLPVRVENRQNTVTRNIVWDPLRRTVEPLACNGCFRASNRLFLCANNHLVCDRCLAPQCVDCKRVYCQSCSHELAACAVCGCPVCQKSLTRCRECGKGTCREHANQCHAPVSTAPSPVTETVSTPLPQADKPRPAAQPPKPVAKREHKPPSARPQPDPGYRLQVEVETTTPVVVAFVSAKGRSEHAQRIWELTEEGIHVTCICEKGWQCPADGKVIAPETVDKIENQIEEEIKKLRVEYRVPSFRASYGLIQRGEFQRIPKLRLRGDWKDEELLNEARAAVPAAPPKAAASPPDAPPFKYPAWILAFSPAEAERFMPDIDRFVRLAYGWLYYEGALNADELTALTASVARPLGWYTPDHARDIFKADEKFRLLRGNVVALEFVKHPLKVLKAKEARNLPPCAFSAEGLLAAADGAIPLTPREIEIESALNRNASRKIYLRSLQSVFRNSDAPSEIFNALFETLAPRDAAEAQTFLDLMSELWNHTPRYELRGRTPLEVHANRETRS